MSTRPCNAAQCTAVCNDNDEQHTHSVVPAAHNIFDIKFYIWQCTYVTVQFTPMPLKHTWAVHYILILLTIIGAIFHHYVY